MKFGLRNNNEENLLSPFLRKIKTEKYLYLYIFYYHTEIIYNFQKYFGKILFKKVKPSQFSSLSRFN